MAYTPTEGNIISVTAQSPTLHHAGNLMSFLIRADTFRLLGKVLDHDDTVEADDLSDSFQRTAQAWQVSCYVYSL